MKELDFGRDAPVFFLFETQVKHVALPKNNKAPFGAGE